MSSLCGWLVGSGTPLDKVKVGSSPDPSVAKLGLVVLSTNNAMLSTSTLLRRASEHVGVGVYLGGSGLMLWSSGLAMLKLSISKLRMHATNLFSGELPITMLVSPIVRS